MSRYSEVEVPVKYTVTTCEGDLQAFEDACNILIAAGWKPMGGVSTTWVGYPSEGDPVLQYSQAFVRGIE